MYTNSPDGERKDRCVAIGTPESLKNKFGQGYTLEVKLTPKTEEVKQIQPTPSGQVQSDKPGVTQGKSKIKAAFEDEIIAVADKFPGCRILESFGNRAIYSILIGSFKSVSQAFATLEACMLTLNIML